MLTTHPRFTTLMQTLPLDNIVRIEVSEGLPIFRALPHVQERIEKLLEKQQTFPLSASEKRELTQYEELDDFLSLVNRLTRNLMQGNGNNTAHAKAI
ncbi:MAG: hypothetical protein HZC38_18825 [Chloroflexi bacterium]|nr:hypothetical protein [Chloroflexota bacterium]